MFRASVEASLRLFFQDRKLYDIAASAATERWPAVQAYELAMGALLQDILQQGRKTGDFERKTPLDETASAIYLVMRPTQSLASAHASTARNGRVQLPPCLHFRRKRCKKIRRLT